jgi:hypothetical protein
MMLMTKFGKFKLRLIANFSVAGLLSIINLFAANSSYWVKYMDAETHEHHFAGLWRSCPAQGPCSWRSGIIDAKHSFWALSVRFFIVFGSLVNVLTVLLYFMAFVFKLNKKTRCVLRLLDWGNLLNVASLMLMLIGFAIFVSNACNVSVWLHALAMLLIVVTSNLITRTFADLYFSNTQRLGPATKSSETGMSHAKLAAGDLSEERIALAPMPSQAPDFVVNGDRSSAKIQMSPVLVTSAASKRNSKVLTSSDAHGSNEALIPGVKLTAPAVEVPPSAPILVTPAVN